MTRLPVPWPRAVPPDEDEPAADDWMAVGSDMRTVLNQWNAAPGLPPVPPPTEHRCPTFDELAAWERVLPGASVRLVEMARAEHAHRQEMARLRRPLSWLWPRWWRSGRRGGGSCGDEEG